MKGVPYQGLRQLRETPQNAEEPKRLDSLHPLLHTWLRLWNTPASGDRYGPTCPKWF
jgi:hypothetical protein